MGRRKIAIRPISDPKLRHSTFNKRKNGLIKKAAEISMLCDLRLLLIFEDVSGKLIQYSTDGIYKPEEYFADKGADNTEEFTSKDYPNFFKVNHYKKTRERMKLEKLDVEDDSSDESDLPSEDSLKPKLRATTKRQLELKAKVVEKPKDAESQKLKDPRFPQAIKPTSSKHYVPQSSLEDAKKPLKARNLKLNITQSPPESQENLMNGNSQQIRSRKESLLTVKEQLDEKTNGSMNSANIKQNGNNTNNIQVKNESGMPPMSVGNNMNPNGMGYPFVNALLSQNFPTDDYNYNDLLTNLALNDFIRNDPQGQNRYEEILRSPSILQWNNGRIDDLSPIFKVPNFRNKAGNFLPNMSGDSTSPYKFLPPLTPNQNLPPGYDALFNNFRKNMMQGSQPGQEEDLSAGRNGQFMGGLNKDRKMNNEFNFNLQNFAGASPLMFPNRGLGPNFETPPS